MAGSIQTLLSNLSYLTKYKLKESFRDLRAVDESALLYRDIQHLLKQADVDFRNFVPASLKVMDVIETLSSLHSSNCSLARFGDGEFSLIFNQDLNFQNYHPQLKEKLLNILSNPDPNCLVAIPACFYNKNIALNDLINTYCLEFYFTKHQSINSLLSNTYCYGASELTLTYNYYKVNAFNHSAYYESIQKLFLGMKNVVIVSPDVVIEKHDVTKLGIPSSFQHLSIPSKNAFNSYDDILNSIYKYSTDYIVLLIAGPTATALAYDLTKEGYRALDIGHIFKDFDAFQNSLTVNADSLKCFFDPD